MRVFKNAATKSLVFIKSYNIKRVVSEGKILLQTNKARILCIVSLDLVKL